MGGFGSGRIGYKRLAENVKRIDIRDFHKKGTLQDMPVSSGLVWSRDGEYSGSVGYEVSKHDLVLKYQYTSHWDDSKTDVHYTVPIEWTPCNLGGSRPWFICPMHNCGKRVRILYQGNSKYFNCRTCAKVAYTSQNEHISFTCDRRAQKIWRKIQPNWQNEWRPPRPKGMHHKTYERLVEEGYNLQEWGEYYADLKVIEMAAKFKQRFNEDIGLDKLLDL